MFSDEYYLKDMAMYKFGVEQNYDVEDIKELILMGRKAAAKRKRINAHYKKVDDAEEPWTDETAAIWEKELEQIRFASIKDDNNLPAT